MAFKFITFAAILAYAQAGNLIGAPLAAAPLAYSAPLTYAAPAIAKVAAPVAVARAEPYDPNPQYSFGYEVQDGLTGDSKNQFETRSGDVVQGQYSLVESDGTRRIVDYVADPINGFNANVRKEPLVAKAVVAAPAAPLIRSAPLLAQPAIASSPFLRSSFGIGATPLLRSGPIFSSGYGIGATPLLRSGPILAGGYGIGATSLLRSGPILAGGYAAAPALGYSAAYGKIASAALGYSSFIH